MDIKVYTKSETFLIYNSNTSYKMLLNELANLISNINDLIIFFYDNEYDRVVILEDRDIQYAYDQAKIKGKYIVNFYTFHKQKRLQPKTQVILNNVNLKKISIEKSINDELNPNLRETGNFYQETKTREYKLKIAVNNYVSQLLKNQYEIYD